MRKFDSRFQAYLRKKDAREKITLAFGEIDYFEQAKRLHSR